MLLANPKDENAQLVATIGSARTGLVHLSRSPTTIHSSQDPNTSKGVPFTVGEGVSIHLPDLQELPFRWLKRSTQ
jgi:hypothetical protein